MKDHECWVRPENMSTPRTVLQINDHTPGTEIAAETAAALAASSIVFNSVDRPYAHRLRNKAKLVFIRSPLVWIEMALGIPEIYSKLQIGPLA